jgi:hypothetical protein
MLLLQRMIANGLILLRINIDKRALPKSLRKQTYYTAKRHTPDDGEAAYPFILKRKKSRRT